MSSNEKKKDKKKRLSSLLLMLFLTIILLTTSTYAWFTSNRNVQIANIDVNVSAADGIQISTDAENWKTVISNADILKGYDGDTNMWSGTMSPVSTVKTPNAAGKLDMYLGEVKSDENDTTEAGRFELTATSLAANETHSNSTEGNRHYITFDVFLKKFAEVFLDQTEENKDNLPKNKTLLTTDSFVQRWMYAFGPSTFLGLELFVPFATILTDCSIGAFLNQQNTIEKVVGPKNITLFANELTKIGSENA